MDPQGGARGDGDDEAVDEHPGAGLRGGDDGTRQRGNLQAADASEDLQRWGTPSGNRVLLERCDDDARLVAHALWVEPSAGADELVYRCPKQRRGDGCGSSRVADAHLAEDDEVGAILDGAGNRPASGSEREGELLARHGRLLLEVARAAPWLIHRYTGDSDARQRTGIDDSERHTQLACQHRDRLTAAGGHVQELDRDVGRIGRDPSRDDAVVAGEQHYRRVLGARTLSRLQGSEANGQSLEHAERARWLGQDALPRLGRRATLRAWLWAGALDPRLVHAA